MTQMIETATQLYLNTLQQKVNEHYQQNFSNLTPPVYTLEPGRKYVKVVQNDTTHTGRSVHSFIDKATGDLYKPAGWKAPAKDARYNLIRDAATLKKVIDPYGSYLYKQTAR